MICHVPYASGQQGTPDLDLVIVYFFQQSSKREPHKYFFECPESDMRLERRASFVASESSDGMSALKGITGDAIDPTKAGPQGPMNWLTHPNMLPEILPFNRTICVGYALSSKHKDGMVNFAAASAQLLDALDDNRKDCRARPIILIGHGLGCRVVQHAIMRPAYSERILSLQDRCAGTLFLHAPDSSGGAGLPSTAAENATCDSTEAKDAFFVEPDPRFVVQSSSQDSRTRAILHHVLQHGATDQDRSSSFKFPGKNDRIFQKLGAKLVEWSEIHQLMSAVTKADYGALRKLIDDGVKINQRKNSSQMTALHVACQTLLSQPHHIHLLIENGKADVTLQDSYRRTPLHYALDRDNPDVEMVRALLEAGAETFVTDQDGITPMNMAKSCGASKVRKLLRKRPLVKGPSAAKGSVSSADPHSREAEDVCKSFQMVATEMYLNRQSLTEKHLPRHFLVHEAIYGQKSLKALLDETRSSSIKDELICRWYHLPANNMVWVEDLFRNRFRMHPHIWSEQVRDSEWPHGRCIKPHTSRFATESGEAILAICIPYVSYEDNYRQESVSATVREHIPNTRTSWFRPMGERLRRSSPSSDNLDIPQDRKRQADTYTDFHAHVRRQQLPPRSDSEISSPDQHAFAQSSSQVTSSYDSGSDSEADISDGGKFHAANVKLSKEEETLVQAYLHHDPPLHIRRTLDQYYYYMLEDTRVRDADQVVTRWAKKLQRHRHNILMVDQLWLWVIKGTDGPDRVVSCFPERQGYDSGLLDYLQRNVLHHNADKRQPIKTTADLVAQIIATCSDVFSWSQEAELARFLHFFEATVGRVGDDEIGLLNNFTKSSEKLHALKDTHFHYAKDKDELLIEMLDIRPQVELLKEAKDIRDEIKIILHVLGEQRRVIADESILTFFDPDRGSTPNRESGKILTKPLRIIDRAIGDFQKMDKQMKEIHDDLNHLLDLQQKQATVWEARSTRENARATSRQGNVMVIFTMVTIIFLPLSFMASFFALNVREFPANESGQTSWPLHRVCAYLFGISFAVIVPFIALAFASEVVYTACHVVEEDWLIPWAISIFTFLSVSFLRRGCDAAIARIERHREACYGGRDQLEEAAPPSRHNTILPSRTDSEKWPPSELTAFEVDSQSALEHGERRPGLPEWFRRSRRRRTQVMDEDV